MSPFYCPVCNGRGTVPAGFYAFGYAGTSTSPETCKTCMGSGVLWGPPDNGSAFQYDFTMDLSLDTITFTTYPSSHTRSNFDSTSGRSWSN